MHPQATVLGMAGSLSLPELPTWNPLDKGPSLALSQLNLTVSGTTSDVVYNVVRSIPARATGKRYAEFLVRSINVATLAGVATSAAPLNDYLHSTQYGLCYASSGYILSNKAVISTAPTYTANDVVQIAVNFDASTVKFGLNGTWVSGDIPFSGPLFLAASAHTGGDSLLLRTLASLQTYSPPAGYIPWQSEAETGIRAPTSWNFAVSDTYPTSPALEGHLGTQTRTSGGLSDAPTNNSQGSSVWGSPNSANSFIRADFGDLAMVSSITYACANGSAPGNWGATYLAGSLFQVSADGGNWKTILTMPSSASIAENTDYTTSITPVVCRYARLLRSSGYLACGTFKFG